METEEEEEEGGVVTTAGDIFPRPNESHGAGRGWDNVEVANGAARRRRDRSFDRRKTSLACLGGLQVCLPLSWPSGKHGCR